MIAPSQSSDPILPGPDTLLGMLGGGQLGRMFALAAKAMGYRVAVLCPEPEGPLAQIADVVYEADYDDLEACEAFAKQCDVVTFEFENIDHAMTEVAERYAPVRPAGRVLHTTQHRIREKTFLRDAGLPVTPFAAVETESDLQAAVEDVGLPAVMKTAAWGYDGKGQMVLRKADQLAEAYIELGQQPVVLEKMIDFERELSVVAVRSITGESQTFGPMQNIHAKHILDLSLCPAPIDPEVAERAIEIAHLVMHSLDVVGVLCVELFMTHDGELMINELAPRPHNSGHLTIEGHVTSQFEQQVRAVCGLPLGSTRQIAPAVMANLLGDHWPDPSDFSQHPDWAAALSHSDVHLHLYGKEEPRIGRKMGHLTALADSIEQAEGLALRARDSLYRSP